MPCVPSGALTRAAVLLRRMADDGNGSKKAKMGSFSVFRAVGSDGGRGGVQRTEAQRKADEHKKKNMQQMMEEGMSSKEAFGQCSKNRAEQRRSDELVTPVVLGSPAPLSGRPPTPPTREGSGKERSPSFKPESEACRMRRWRPSSWASRRNMRQRCWVYMLSKAEGQTYRRATRGQMPLEAEAASAKECKRASQC